MGSFDRVDRRRFLQLSGAASVVAVAGCLGDDNGGAGDVSYNQYIGTEDRNAFYVYADFQALEALEDDEDESDDPDDEMPEFEDPLLAPMGGIFLLGFAAGFTFGPAGLGDLLEPDEDSDLDSSADELLFSAGGLVAAGDMDTDELAETLTEEPDDELFATQYEEDGELDEYTVYVPVEDEDSVFLVGESEVIAGESRDDVQIVVDAIDGDGRASDEFDAFDELLGVAGDGMIAMGGFGDEGVGGVDETAGADDDLFQTAMPNGFVSSLDVTDDEISAVFAAAFDDLSEDDQDGIRNEFESDRTEVSIEFDDGLLTAEATYEADLLDEQAQ